MKPQVILLSVMAIIIVAASAFAYLGVSMHNQVHEREARLHDIQEEYFNTPKAERDSAPRGSELNAQLVEIKQTPSALLELKLVGMGRILTGIFLILLGILIALMVMPMRIRMVLHDISRENR